MSLEDFTRPITIATRTQFLTARAVARHMIRQGSGVILTITAGLLAEPFPMSAASTQPAAIEGLWRTFAAELGSYGIRSLL